MKLKDGVVLLGLQTEMRKVLKLADFLWKRYGQELVITAALDGVHSAGSLHYYGLALDFRTRYFKPGIAKIIVGEMKEKLPHEYDVVLESTHIHVEFDPKD